MKSKWLEDMVQCEISMGRTPRTTLHLSIKRKTLISPYHEKSSFYMIHVANNFESRIDSKKHYLISRLLKEELIMHRME